MNGTNQLWHLDEFLLFIRMPNSFWKIKNQLYYGKWVFLFMDFSYRKENIVESLRKRTVQSLRHGGLLSDILESEIEKRKEGEQDQDLNVFSDNEGYVGLLVKWKSCHGIESTEFQTKFQTKYAIIMIKSTMG